MGHVSGTRAGIVGTHPRYDFRPEAREAKLPGARIYSAYPTAARWASGSCLCGGLELYVIRGG